MTRSRLILLGALALAASRLLHYAAVDTSIRAEGSEAADLYRVATNHQALRGYLPTTFAEQIATDFKPPLWYGGLAVLQGGAESLSVFPFLVLNAILLVVAALGVHRLADRVLGDDRRALAATVVFLFLPGVAGRVTQVGVEPLHMALAPWILLLLVRALDRPWTPSEAIRFGLLLGLGVLAKWNFGAYFLPGFGFALWVALRRRTGVGSLLVGGAVAAALFAVWAIPFLDLDALTTAVGQERVPIVSFYVSDLLLVSLGVGCWPLIALRIAGGLQSRARPSAAAWLLLLTVVFGVALHTAIPHKEGRYLLPLLPALVVLLIPPMRRPGRRAPAGAVGLVVIWSLLGPAIAERLGPPVSDWTDRAVFLTPNDEPQAADVVLRHPALTTAEIGRVAFLATPEQESLRLTLVWELYARNAKPVVGMGPVPRVADLPPGDRFVMDLLPPGPQDAAFIARGFDLAAQAELDYPGEPRIRLWTRAGGGRLRE